MYLTRLQIRNRQIDKINYNDKDWLPSSIKSKQVVVDEQTNLIYLTVRQNVSAAKDATQGLTPKKNCKTELCKNFIKWSASDRTVPFYCPYAKNCKFAHGPNELARFSDPYDMHAHGVIEDPDTYLCLPCFDQVATGSCPMGSRCPSLHDPRVKGTNPAWLELWKKPKKTSLCAIPDSLYYHRNISRFQMNPIVDYRTWKMFRFIKVDAFEATYDLVCNINVPVFDHQFVASQRTTKLSEVQRLCIVRAMTQNRNASDHDFIYSNKHCLNGQACLVLQTRYFRLLQPTPSDVAIKLEDIIQEMSSTEFDPRSNVMVRADEIIFESKGKHNCNRSIWFDANVTHWGGRNFKRQASPDLYNLDGKALFCMPNNESFELNLPTVTPHILMQPKDDCEEGHDLIDAILEHRINSILASQGRRSYLLNKFAALKADFARLQKITEKWTWPSLTKHQVNIIVQKMREEHVNSEYVPIDVTEENILPAIWSTFVGEHQTKKRLDVFVSLTIKEEKASYEKLPHITSSPTKFVSQLSEDTWKELLLGEDGPWTNAKMHLDGHSPSKARASS